MIGKLFPTNDSICWANVEDDEPALKQHWILIDPPNQRQPANRF